MERHVCQALNLSGYPDNARLESVVDAFHADLSCQVLMNSTSHDVHRIVRHVQMNSSKARHFAAPHSHNGYLVD